MTGEMGWIKPNGEASNGECYSLHASVARAMRGKLRPFDSYIGPYIKVPAGRLWLTSEDGEVGTACLWPDGIAPAYAEPFTAEFFPLDSESAALNAARECVRAYRKQQRKGK